MYRSRDFMTMSVMDVKGKKIGYISDISMDLQNNKIDGFVISQKNMIVKKDTMVKKDEVIYFDKNMIVSKLSEEKKLKFSQIKGMNMVNINGNGIGIIEDILINNKLLIKGYIVSSGFLDKIIRGKRIVLSNKIIVGDKNVLSFDKKGYNFMSIRHGMTGVECDE